MLLIYPTPNKSCPLSYQYHRITVSSFYEDRAFPCTWIQGYISRSLEKKTHQNKYAAISTEKE